MANDEEEIIDLSPKSKSFTFNGTSSKAMGLEVQVPPSYSFPDRDVTTVSVPGKNGDLHLDNKRYKNVTRTYNVTKKFKNNSGILSTDAANAETILNWLTSGNNNYVRLVDEYDPTVYRLARFNNSGSFINYLDRANGISISFDCKPQRFLLSGENEVVYSAASSVTIDNTYQDNSYTLSGYIERNYASLPLIKIINIPTSSTVTELMLTVANKNGEKTSSITISTDTDSLYIDSTEQTIKNASGDNLLPYCSLNGKPFPELQGGTNTLTLKRYNKKSWKFDTYNKLINDNKDVVQARYQRKIDLEEARQHKFKIKSYNSLRESKSEKYPANSVRALIEENCKTFLAPSFNDIMKANSKVYQFMGDLPGDPSTQRTESNGIITREQAANSTGIVYKVNALSFPDWVNGGWFIINGNSRIQWYDCGALLGTFSNDTLIEIKYYPAKKISNEPVLDIDYSAYNIPNWIKFEIGYATYGTIKALSKIDYMTNAGGYYYFKDNSFLSSLIGGLFGDKSYWKYIQASSPVIFDTLIWNESSKEFKSNSGSLFGLGSNVLEYRYISQLPEYKDITTQEKDEDGNIREKTTAKCRFIYIDQSPNQDLSSITINPKELGWYKFGTGDDDKFVEITNLNQSIKTGLSGSSAFEIAYLEEPPTYEGQEDWPDFINVVPVKTTYITDISQMSVGKTYHWENTDIIGPVDYDLGPATSYLLISNIVNLETNTEKSSVLGLVDSFVGCSEPQGFDGEYVKLSDDPISNECYKRFVGSFDFIYEGWASDDIPYYPDDPSIINQVVNGHVSTREPLNPMYPNKIKMETTNQASTYSYRIREVGGTEYSEWIEDVGASTEINFELDPSKDYEMFYIESVPEDHADYYDRVYYINGSELETVDPPLWLNAVFYDEDGNIITPPVEDYDPPLKEIKYKAASDGWYLWDNNSIWLWKTAGSDLFTSGPKNEHDFYYLAAMPEYDSGHVEPQDTSWETLFKISNPSDTNHVFSEILYYKILTAGYYKTNASSDWKYLEANDVLVESKLNETNTILFLEPINNDDLSSVVFKITPNWWML